jgi:hypothetical protein
MPRPLTSHDREEHLSFSNIVVEANPKIVHDWADRTGSAVVTYVGKLTCHISHFNDAGVFMPVAPKLPPLQQPQAPSPPQPPRPPVPPARPAGGPPRAPTTTRNPLPPPPPPAPLVRVAARISPFQDADVSYDVYSVERTYNDATGSAFTRMTLVGTPFTVERERVICEKPYFDGYYEGLWCMNCWTDDRLRSGTGGVKIPRYLPSAFRVGEIALRLPSCTCGCKFKPAPADTQVDLRDTPADPRADRRFVFSTLANPGFAQAVDQVMVQAGLPGAVHLERVASQRLAPEVHEGVIMTAMHPDRISRMAKKANMGEIDYVDRIYSYD